MKKFSQQLSLVIFATTLAGSRTPLIAINLQLLTQGRCSIQDPWRRAV